MCRMKQQAAAAAGEQSEYLSYLLRVWRVRGEDKAVWRASLESSLTGKVHGFNSLDDIARSCGRKPVWS